MINRDTNVQKSDNKPENVVIIRGGGDLRSEEHTSELQSH